MSVGCSIARDIICTHDGDKVKSHVNEDVDGGKVVSEKRLLPYS